MIQEVSEYFTYQDRFKSWEIVIVDDGSRDQTTRLALELSKKIKEIKVLTLKKNRGKGGAVMQVIECYYYLILIFLFERELWYLVET